MGAHERHPDPSTGSTAPAGLEAIVQRFRPVAGGYPMAIRLASTAAPVTDWYAEVRLPDGAAATAGPRTTVSALPQAGSYRLAPARPQLAQPGTGVVYAAVGGTQAAPTHVRVFAKTGQGSGWVPIAGIYVTGPRRNLLTATEQTWPGSTQISTDPQSWGGGAGFGFGGGFGGGGGGGGQVELVIETDDAGRLRRVTHKTDCGGGGGTGGGLGGGAGAGWQAQAAAGQQQGQQSQQQQGNQGNHQGGNPLTRLEQTVAGMDARLTRLETSR